MNKSSNNDFRNRYPTKISNELSKINKVNLTKIDNRELLIHTRWEEMVGNFFSIYSQPDKLKIFNDNNSKNYSGILYVKIVGAAAIEFQHFIDKIIDKINSFFGYQLITLKLRHNNWVLCHLLRWKLPTGISQIQTLKIQRTTKAKMIHFKTSSARKKARPSIFTSPLFSLIIRKTSSCLHLTQQVHYIKSSKSSFYLSSPFIEY